MSNNCRMVRKGTRALNCSAMDQCKNDAQAHVKRIRILNEDGVLYDVYLPNFEVCCLLWRADDEQND